MLEARSQLLEAFFVSFVFFFVAFVLKKSQQPVASCQQPAAFSANSAFIREIRVKG
jgi:hypothetical protein